MFKFNNSVVPNKVRIGWHFSSNKYACRDAYLALKSRVTVTVQYNLQLQYIYSMVVAADLLDITANGVCPRGATILGGICSFEIPVSSTLTIR